MQRRRGPEDGLPSRGCVPVCFSVPTGVESPAQVHEALETTDGRKSGIVAL
jgi:hypothetical protein